MNLRDCDQKGHADLLQKKSHFSAHSLVEKRKVLSDQYSCMNRKKSPFHRFSKMFVRKNCSNHGKETFLRKKDAESEDENSLMFQFLTFIDQS